MQFFIDTANLKEIQEIQSWGILDGVTTNPTLMAKEGVSDITGHYKKICELVPGGAISAEVISTDFEGMMKEAHELAKIHEQIVIKIPFIKDGIRAISELTKERIRTNCTLIFSPVQALVAAKAGATYVSPFLGRLDDIGHDGMELIRSIRQIFDNMACSTMILAASIRHTLHVLQCAEAGADVITMPYKVFESMIKHPLTDIGLEKFLHDYHQTFGTK
jgi:transaldolase